MFNEDLPKTKPESIFPRDMENMSVHELDEYILELKEEIATAEADIKVKKVSKDAAASVFK